MTPRGINIAANRLQLGTCMASVSSQSIEAVQKVAVVLQGSDEEEMLNRKEWRYNTEEIQQYSLAQVEELLLLFPSIKEKGLRLDIYYRDSFVGRVKLDGDADVHAASSGPKDCVRGQVWEMVEDSCRVSGPESDRESLA
jgi:hypothetical protein